MCADTMKGKLPVGTIVYPVHYERGKDTGLVWRNTKQTLTKEDIILEHREEPPDIRKHFPSAFDYVMHLFTNPRKDHHLEGSYVFGFIFMEQDLIGFIG